MARGERESSPYDYSQFQDPKSRADVTPDARTSQPVPFVLVVAVPDARKDMCFGRSRMQCCQLDGSARCPSDNPGQRQSQNSPGLGARIGSKDKGELGRAPKKSNIDNRVGG